MHRIGPVAEHENRGATPTHDAERFIARVENEGWGHDGDTS